MSTVQRNWIERSNGLDIQVRNFVDGRWVSIDDAAYFEKYGPRDGRLLCRFGGGATRDVETALVNARAAFQDGRWSRLPVQRRKDTLHRLAALIEENTEELALLECLDVGKPIADALTIDIPMVAAFIRYSAEAADKWHGKVYSVDPSSLSYQLHRPWGVVAAIVGWNFPLVLAAAKVGPILATGNCVVVKPSELSSLATGRLAELAVEAGVPPGVLNVVHGGSAVGAALASHPEVNLVSFTGSTSTGKRLLIAAGESNMKRTILECGGKAPSIVFDDCPNPNAVAEAVVARAFWNQGEVCTASSRLLIQEGIKEEVLALVIEKVSALSLGDPLDPDTKLGALISRDHMDKVKRYIDKGESEGGRVVFRGSCPAPITGGFYVPPVVFDQVRADHTIAQQEIFGPVLSIMAFRDEEEAIRIANSTIYGLSAIAWTKDLGRAHRLAQAIDVGWMVVNATGKPFGGPGSGVLSIGGHRQSGIGGEGGLEGLEAYMSTTAVQYFV